MFAIAALFSAVLGLTTVAQVTPPPAPPAPPAAASAVEPLDNGPCLDSARAVPHVLQSPAVRAMQIVRIDRIESTGTMISGDTIGFLYTLSDGSTWLGERAEKYVSPAGAHALNQVLASTHMPGQNVKQFPPQTRYGVPTNYAQFFRVQLPPDALGALQVEVVPCVAWPSSRPLPDPVM
jgi:hypothetical protein